MLSFEVLNRLIRNRCSDNKHIELMTEKFRRYLRVELNLAETTIRGYWVVVRRFLRENNVIYPSRKLMLNWLDKLKDRGVSRSHVRNTSTGFEHYMRFLGKSTNLPKPMKKRKAVRDYLTESEVNRIIINSKNFRERVIFSTLAYTGMRAMELCSLRVSSLDLQHLIITVTNGKGSKDRVVNIPQRLVNLLDEFIKKEKKEFDDFLFKNETNEKHISPWRLRKILKRAGKKGV